MLAQEQYTQKPDTLELKMFPDEDPEFPGGIVALQKFIIESLVYPDSLMLEDVVGKIYLSFIVFKDGSIGEVKVERGVSEQYDKMAMGLFKSMPNWTPAKKNGRAIDHKVFFPLNIHFY